MVTSEPQEQQSRARRIMIILIVALALILIMLPSLMSINKPDVDPRRTPTTPLSH